MRERPLEDWEDPDPDDEREDEDDEGYVCPACGASVYEDAECCPACGEYITPRRTSAWSPPARWLQVVAVVLVVVLVGMTLLVVCWN